MKTFVVICVLAASLNTFAQNKVKFKDKHTHNAIKYLTSSDELGSSDAVTVDEVPLAHTAQFLPLDNRGNVVAKDDLRKQVDQVFRHISAALKPAGTEVHNIIKLNIFLKSTDLISHARSLIAAKFDSGKKPAMTFIAGDLAHPDALISIDAIAVSYVSSADRVQMPGTPDSKGQAQVAILPKGPVVYVSGQAAKGGLAEATRGTLKQLKETLGSLGLTLKDLVQIKTFLTPMSSLNIVEKEFSEFFKGEIMPPLVFVDWISNDPLIEIEIIAASPASSNLNAQIEYITPPGMTASPVYSKVTKLNYGKKVFLSGIAGPKLMSTDAELISIFDKMNAVLTASGSSFIQLLKATYYINSDQYSKSLADLRPKYYDPLRPPAASKAMVKAIGMNGGGLSIDMIGTIGQ